MVAAMRVLLMIVMFAIGFSGYSAAAHAARTGSCDPAATSKAGGGGASAGLASHGDHAKEQETGKSAAGGDCVDCGHCCASHAFGLAAHAVNFHRQETALAAPPVEKRTGDYLSSLLRPPKSLV